MITQIDNMFLDKELNEIESLIPHKDLINIEVSKSDIGWHLLHTLLVIQKIHKVMDNSNPEEYAYEFNIKRNILFIINKIPRGRAKAPSQVQPSNAISADSIKEHLIAVRQLSATYGNLPKNAHFKHPYLGTMPLKQAMKFIKIHTEHHLKIARSILKTSS